MNDIASKLEIQRTSKETLAFEFIGNWNDPFKSPMTAIITAGRSEVVFTAQMSTMMVNEEIDALRTMGFSPINFLVKLLNKFFILKKELRKFGTED